MSDKENPLLAKWLNQSISPEELKLLEQEVDLVQLAAILDRQKGFDLEVKDTNQMWEQFQQKADLDPSDAPRESQPKRHLNRGWILLGIFLLMALIGFLIFKPSSAEQQIKTQPTETKAQHYADGSSIEISPGSSITFNNNTWEKERLVHLEGHAYFEVSKGAPFIVETDNGTIEVLGTGFDIWSFDDYISIQCFHGKVRVTNSNRSESVELTGSQQVSLNKNTFRVVEKLGANHPNWINKKEYIYKKIPVNLILKDINRFLGIEVETSGLNVTTDFSGLIPFKTPEETARYLAASMGWNYTVTNDKIIFNK